MIKRRTRGGLFLSISGLGVCALTTLAGCSRAPESLAQQAARATPETTITEAASGLSEGTTPLPDAAPPQEETSVAPLGQQFKNPQTQAAVADYQLKWEQLQDDRESGENLGAIDPLVNPQAITDYAGRIGAHANQLDQAERAARVLMDPNEKKRFKALQKQLEAEQAEE